MFDISLEGISIGPLEFRFYSLMILTGIGVGVIIAQREAKRYGEDPAHVVNIAVIGALSAIVGARLYHVFDQGRTTANTRWTSSRSGTAASASLAR